MESSGSTKNGFFNLDHCIGEILTMDNRSCMCKSNQEPVDHLFCTLCDCLGIMDP